MILVADTRITIIDVLTGVPFCRNGISTDAACTDLISGFDFLFTGENILGVSVNPASAAAFLPVSGTFQGNTHLGLQLLGNNEIRVDVTGDLPSLNDMLILDLRFAATPPPSVPEPASLALLALGLAGLGFSKRRNS